MKQKDWLIITDKKGKKKLIPFPKNDPTIWGKLANNKIPKVVYKK